MVMRSAKGERGFSLLEVLVALGILGFIGVAFLSGVGTSSRATRTLDQQVVAEELAREQLANVMSLPFADSYTVTISPPGQYLLSLDSGTAAPVAGKSDDCKLQYITASVTNGGRPVLSVTTYRHNPDSAPC